MHTLLTIYGWGTFFSFFLFVFVSGVHKEQMDKVHKGVVLQAIAILFVTMFWFVILPYDLGRIVAEEKKNKSDRPW